MHLAAASIETNRGQNAKVSLFSGAIQQKGIDFSRAVRGIRRLPHQNEHHQFAFGGSAGLHALREEVS